jgi:quinol monooxygenase YgiN
MSQPVIVTATFLLRPGSRDAVLEALRPAVAAVHEESGCELYALYETVDGSLVMIEKWQSVELLDAHGTSKAVSALGRVLADHLMAPVDVIRMTSIPMGTMEQGAL